MCDLKGQPLVLDAAVLLKSLDKLLTQGAYYSTDHSQYLAASEEAAQSMAKAIQPRSKIALEITAEGLLILDQTVSSRLRHVHQIHGLLVPLNIARLEIHANLTAADLRLAIQVLAEHRHKYGHTETFQEIVIEGLPPTIQSVSISVLEKSQSSEDSGSGLSDVRQMVENWGRSAEGDQSEELAKEFMAMVTAILNNLEHQGGTEETADHESPGAMSLSPGEIEQLRASFQRLVEVNPSPRVLTRLITHARSALELSRDTIKADLVFQTLRKGLQEIPEPAPDFKSPLVSQTEYTMEVDDLRAEVDQLEKSEAPVLSMPRGAASAHLYLCLSLLRSDPPAAMRQSLEETLVGLVQDARAGESILAPFRRTVLDTLESGFTEWVDELVVSLTSALRRGKTSLLGEFWAGLKPLVHEADLLVLWPHLVNDILLGLGRVEGNAGREVLVWAGSLTPGTALAQVDRLKIMPAVQGKKAAGDIFKAPLPALYSVHNALAQTSLAEWLSRGLFKSMKAHPLNGLTKALMGAVEFDPRHLGFYLELIGHSGGQDLAPQTREKAASLLLGILTGLPRVRRMERWVTPALMGLADLQVESARPLFEEICNSRRLLVLKAWPEDCRHVAENALAKNGGQHG